MNPPNGNGGYRLGSVVAPAVSAALHVVLIGVICFGIGPQIDAAVGAAREAKMATERNREIGLEIQALLVRSQQELEENRQTVRRINELLDEAVERAKKAKQKE